MQNADRTEPEPTEKRWELPDSLRGRVNDLSVPQLIALRFASDAEVPDLVKKTLDGNLDAKTIKQSIQNWRADFLRV